MAVVTVTAAWGQGGRTGYFRLWLSFCSPGWHSSWELSWRSVVSKRVFSTLLKICCVHRARGSLYLPSWPISAFFSTWFRTSLCTLIIPSINPQPLQSDTDPATCLPSWTVPTKHRWTTVCTLWWRARTRRPSRKISYTYEAPSTIQEKGYQSTRWRGLGGKGDNFRCEVFFYEDQEKLHDQRYN